MNFIVFDLEATCWDGAPDHMVQEIIEIGALKLNRFGEEEGRFSMLIRPILNPVLSTYCKNLTTIDQIEINRANTFPVVIDAFLDWVEADDDEYVLCSWGGKDKLLLLQDCQLHHYEDDWVEDHLNVRKQYHELKKLRRRRSLKHSIEVEGFEFTGQQHRALADAENLAKIFFKYLDLWQY